MTNFYATSQNIIPESAHSVTAVLTCSYNERMQCPGMILFCDATTANLTGFSKQKILTCSFSDLCSNIPLLNSSDFDKDIHFRGELKTFSGLPLLCDFSITCMYNSDSLFLQIKVHPVAFEKHQIHSKNDTIPVNKLDTLDILSHGISHGISNSINLITLSSDLLLEMVDELLSQFDPEAKISIRGMGISELSKLVRQLTENLLKSATRINSTSQALVHYLRGNVEPAPANYDIRKILHTAVLLTEYEILKSSYEFIYEPPQGIIKRTGNQHEILQAIFNCILFLCCNASGRNGRFSITTKIRLEQNNFCIQIQHDVCPLSEEDLNAVIFINNQSSDIRHDHPLIVARELITSNSGELEVLHEKSGCVRITITFSSVSIY
jgi:hypothetical protein